MANGSFLIARDSWHQREHEWPLAPRPTTMPLQFLHFPKTGSSWSLTMELHGGSVYWHHDPVGQNATWGELQNVAVLFRHPEDRLLSMYWWIRQTNGQCCEIVDFGWPSGRERYHVFNAVRQGGSPDLLARYSHCQLHMVMGHKCCSRHEYMEPMGDVLAAAKQRVDAFSFVGLTSEWLLSACLFNFKMTGHRFVVTMQLKNCRPTTINSMAANGFNGSLKNLSILPRDDAEHELFDHATERFWREVKAHNITSATCPCISNRTWGCRQQTLPWVHRQMMHSLNVSALLSTAST